MKTCTKCKTAKDEAEFSKLSSAKDGLNYRCKACIRQDRQTDARKDSVEAYQQTDAFKASQKACRQTDARKEYQKKYQQAYRLRKKAAASSDSTGQSGDTMGAQE